MPKGTIVLTGSPEHQAQCKHPLVDPVANQCTACKKVLGSSMPEQMDAIRKRLDALEATEALWCLECEKKLETS